MKRPQLDPRSPETVREQVRALDVFSVVAHRNRDAHAPQAFHRVGMGIVGTGKGIALAEEHFRQPGNDRGEAGTFFADDFLLRAGGRIETTECRRFVELDFAAKPGFCGGASFGRRGGGSCGSRRRSDRHGRNIRNLVWNGCGRNRPSSGTWRLPGWPTGKTASWTPCGKRPVRTDRNERRDYGNV